MRIVNRDTFIGMPPGTLFSKYEPCVFGDLMIKGESIIFDGGNDFFYQQIADSVKASGSNELVNILDDSEENGTSFDMDFHLEGRDGLFEYGQLFAIWEPSDVSALIDRLKEVVG